MSHVPADTIEEDNELAERLARWLERLRPHAAAIGLAILAILATVVGLVLVSGQSEATRAQSWSGYLSALSTGEPAGFQEVISRYPDSPAADWSRLVLAELSLREGTDLAFVDRARSRGRLEAASQLFGAVLGSRPKGMLAERAVFGLAKARESLGSLEEARLGYEAVAREYPDDALAALAKTRAEALGKESTRKWYDWFEAQDVTPPKPKPKEDAVEKTPEPPKEPADEKPSEPKATESESKPVDEPKPAGPETKPVEESKPPAAVGDFPPAPPEKPAPAGK